MLPLLPFSTLTRTQSFISQEWNTYFSNGRVDEVDDGWKGILFANMASVDPRRAWKFFASEGFEGRWLDGGACRSWYLAFCAGELMFFFCVLMGWVLGFWGWGVVVFFWCVEGVGGGFGGGDWAIGDRG